MANRRMISKSVIKSDAFTMLPLAAQALYVHILMDADDDGFCSNPIMEVRSIGAKKKDLDLLIEKGFLISFDDGIVLVKHWLVSNLIKKDRHKPTEYASHLSEIYVKPNGIYTKSKDKGIPADEFFGAKLEPNRNQNGDISEPFRNQDGDISEPFWSQFGDILEPQVRLGKDSLGKGSLGKERLGKENLSVNNKCKPVQTSTKQPELLRKFLDFGFLDESELEDPQWGDWLKSQWNTKEEYVDLKIRIDYVLTGISNYVQVGEDGNGKPLFRWRVSPEKLAGIANKYAWFTSAMEKNGKGTTDDGDEPF